MSKELLELIRENPDLPVYAWVNADVVGDGYGFWAGEMHTADVQEYAEVEPYGYEIGRASCRERVCAVV